MGTFGMQAFLGNGSEVIASYYPISEYARINLPIESSNRVDGRIITMPPPPNGGRRVWILMEGDGNQSPVNLYCLSNVRETEQALIYDVFITDSDNPPSSTMIGLKKPQLVLFEDRS